MSHEVELAALEADILKAAQIGDYLKRVAALRVLLAMASPNLVEEALKITAPKVEGVALGAVANAFGLGRDAALGLIDDEKTVARATRRALPSAAARAPVLGLDKAGAAAVASARALSRAGAEPATIVSPLLAHANTLQRSLTYAVNAAGNEGVLAVADTAEVPTVWIAETDACVDCLAYSGQVTDPGEQFPGGLTYGATSPFPDPLDAPPLHPNCLPADALVTPGSRVTGASARIYDGEMIHVKTLANRELSGTPNHPVLTRRGWVGLGFLEPGDEVVSSGVGQRVIRADDNHEHMPALIGQLAKATLSTLQMASREVPVSAMHFHGDGAGSDVGVVAADCLLRREVDAPRCEIHRESLFDVATKRTAALPSQSSTLEHGFVFDGSTDSIMRGRRPLRSLLWGRILHALRHARTAITGLDSSLQQAVADDTAADAEAEADAQLALSGQVFFDQVVDVDRYKFHGEVFNLETERGWYIANGIVTHNCRCTIEPSNDPRFSDALKREADRSVLRGFSLESERQSVRVDAAQRLLDKGVVAPKSVKAFARKSIAAGKFPTRNR